MNALARPPVAATALPFGGFTSADYLQIIDTQAFGELRVELVGGVLEKMMPSNLTHGECNVTVAVLLSQAYAGTGARIGSDVIIEIDGLTVRAADVVVTKPGFAGQRQTRGEDLLLAVEIAASTLARDISKAADYARALIPVYWVVDLGTETVTVMTGPGPDGYAGRKIVRFDEQLTVPETGKEIVIAAA